MDVRSSSPPPLPPLVGRDRELAFLHDCLTAARDGRGSLVLIGGEAGIGKTALADALGRTAVDTGAHVLTGHCYDRTETPPYGPWSEIARRIEGLPADANVPPLPRLDGATSQTDLFARARDFLVALSAARPLLLVLEDLHWADHASLDLLRFVARGIGDLPLLLVATYRGEDIDRQHPLSVLVPLLVREAPTERLNLRPLDAEAVQVLVRGRYDLAERATHRLATYLIERTEGNALLLTELLRSLHEDGLLDRLEERSYAEALRQAPVPALLQQIVDYRLVRLSDEENALLAVAAVVGQEVPLAVWRAVSRADEEVLLTAAERAEAAHLVTASAQRDAIRFTHALIRDVLYEHVPALRRRRLHREASEALIALPAPDPDAVASHLQRAGDERAATWLVRAAERAEDAHALVTAAARYEAALELLDAQQGDAGERGWLQLILAALRCFEDPDRSFARVENAMQLAATAGDPSLAARAEALRGILISYREAYRDALATFATAVDMVDRLPPGTGTIRRREQLIDKVANRGTLIMLLGHGGYCAEARAQGEDYLATFADAATMPGGPGAIADVHNGLSLAYALQGEPALARRSYTTAVAAYLASDNPFRALVRLREELILAVLPYQADDLAERERVAAETERLAAWVVERDGHMNPHLPGYARLPLLVLEGRWREARRLLELPHTPDFTSSGRVRAFYLGTLARAQGDAETAWRCVHEPSQVRAAAEPGEPFTPLLLPFQRLAAELALDASDLPAARGWLDLHHRCLEFMDATLWRAEEHVLEAEWHRAAGDADRARDHAGQALAHATTPRQPLALLAAHRTLGVLAVDAGNHTTAQEHFAAALTLADACRAPYERALTLLAHAELLVSTDEHGRARALLDEAKALCLPLDALPALARIERLTTLLDARTDALPAGLTAREAEVLRLVAVGLSNAEIAERLYLSPNTVKVHVAHVFEKVGARNRVAATEFALRHGLA